MHFTLITIACIISCRYSSSSFLTLLAVIAANNRRVVLSSSSLHVQRELSLCLAFVNSVQSCVNSCGFPAAARLMAPLKLPTCASPGPGPLLPGLLQSHSTPLKNNERYTMWNQNSSGKRRTNTKRKMMPRGDVMSVCKWMSEWTSNNWVSLIPWYNVSSGEHRCLPSAPPPLKNRRRQRSIKRYTLWCPSFIYAVATLAFLRTGWIACNQSPQMQGYNADDEHKVTWKGCGRGRGRGEGEKGRRDWIECV